MIRTRYLDEIKQQYRAQPICAILGPRQVGKTTLARAFADQYFAGDAYFLDLENPADLESLLVNPIGTLSGLPHKLIVIDEIQRRPNLFPILRVLVDRPNNKQLFLILGSASRDLLQQSSETLAGRIGYIELTPFVLGEVDAVSQLWLRGGFPRSYLADDDAISMLWRDNYVNTFLERDIPALGFNIPPLQLRRFWLMLAHWHGQIFNSSEIGKSMEISDHTARRYLDLLAGTFMMRILPPWFENIKKRQVKSPKIYFRDSGILHALIGLSTPAELRTYPRMGSLWEGFALEEVISSLRVKTEECYFWATQSGSELDLFIIKHGKRFGFEFKYTDRPQATKSMHTALEDLKLDHLILVYPGDAIFKIDEKITAYGLNTIPKGTFMDTILPPSWKATLS